jgi:hypothetical protein
VDQSRIIECYEHALDLTKRMHEAASKGDWDGLVQLEIDRGRVIDELKGIAVGPCADDELATRMGEIIAAIMSRDDQIKMLTQDWMHELRDILGSASAQRLLNRTYTP